MQFQLNQPKINDNEMKLKFIQILYEGGLRALKSYVSKLTPFKI